MAKGKLVVGLSSLSHVSVTNEGTGEKFLFSHKFADEMADVLRQAQSDRVALVVTDASGKEMIYRRSAKDALEFAADLKRVLMVVAVAP